MFDTPDVRAVMLEEVPLGRAAPDAHPVELASLVAFMDWQDFLEISHRPVSLSGYRALVRILDYFDGRGPAPWETP